MDGTGHVQKYMDVFLCPGTMDGTGHVQKYMDVFLCPGTMDGTGRVQKYTDVFLRPIIPLTPSTVKKALPADRKRFLYCIIPEYRASVQYDVLS